ncbi:MAG: hypothetical protein ACHQ4G_08915 [Opitutales bacterium]
MNRLFSSLVLILALCPALPAAPAALGKAADNPIYAQHLVNEQMARHAGDLLVLGLHAMPPGKARQELIACNLDRIGKADDDDDIAVSTDHQTILTPNKTELFKFEVQLPLLDVAGRVIGATGIVFKYAPGDDQVQLLAKALAIRADLASQLPDAAALFDTGAGLLAPGPTVRIPNSHGKFDFLEIDGARRRLLAAHEKDVTADFIDLDGRYVIRRLPAGNIVNVIADPTEGRYYLSAQDQQQLVVVDAQTWETKGTVQMPGDIDAILFDPANRRIYAAHDNGSHLWAVDADTLKIVGTTAIPGSPECMVYDAKADRIYLAIKPLNEVAVIDPKANQVVATWPLAPVAQPHGVVFDPATRRLFIAGGNAQIAALDVDTGKVVGTTAIATGVDQAAFDPFTKRIYCAGDRHLSVVQETADGVSLLGNVDTPATAKNVAVDPSTHAVWTTYTDGTDSYARSWTLPGGK